MVTPRRPPVITVAFVDDYCQHYQHLFAQVRNFEAFKFLHLGILSEIKHKSLPAIARAVGLEDSQQLHHFLRDSSWNVAAVRQTRLWMTQLFIGDKEIIFGKRGAIRYYKITKSSLTINQGQPPDPDPKDTWFIMTNLPGKIQLIVAQLYSLKTWIEYGFKQVKNELGWADFRLTDYTSIERWWEMIFGTYLLVSLQANSFRSKASDSHPCREKEMDSFHSSVARFSQHLWWESGTTWKSVLNNLRLIIQPYIFYCLISPWLQVFKIPGFQRGFLKLISFMNDFRASPLPFAIAS